MICQLPDSHANRWIQGALFFHSKHWWVYLKSYLSYVVLHQSCSNISHSGFFINAAYWILDLRYFPQFSSHFYPTFPAIHQHFSSQHSHAISSMNSIFQFFIEAKEEKKQDKLLVKYHKVIAKLSNYELMKYNASRTPPITSLRDEHAHRRLQPLVSVRWWDQTSSLRPRPVSVVA